MAEEKQLNPKQERFCEEYLSAKNISIASILSDYRLQSTPEDGFFVYFLCDPRNQSIFYVGKGKGRRPYHHLNKNLGIKDVNIKKRQVIYDIQQSGMEVEILYFASGLTETAAYKVERAIIKKIGKANLTNIASGLNRQTDSDRAKFLLSKVKSLSKFCAENKSPYEVELYFRVVSGLKTIAA